MNVMKEKKIIKQLQKEVETLKQLLLPDGYNTLNEVWLDSADIKQQFNISDSKLYRLRKNNKIPATIMGGRYYYPKSFFNKVLIDRIKNREKDRLDE